MNLASVHPLNRRMRSLLYRLHYPLDERAGFGTIDATLYLQPAATGGRGGFFDNRQTADRLVGLYF